MADQNLFLICFKNEADLELILAGRPWLFRKQLILFYRLHESVERSKIRLATFPFWLKVGPGPLESDCKDLVHAIGSTFGELLGSEVKGDFCRIRVELNVEKTLRRGIFVVTDNRQKFWVPFKYEMLPRYCFGCGRMGHILRNCGVVMEEVKNLPEDDYPFLLAMKAKLGFVGKIAMSLGITGK